MTSEFILLLSSMHLYRQMPLFIAKATLMAELTAHGNQTPASQILPVSSTFPDSSADSMKSQFTSLTVIQFIDLAQILSVKVL